MTDGKFWRNGEIKKRKPFYFKSCELLYEILELSKPMPQNANQCTKGGHIGCGCGDRSVSYTHLDLYKRQVLFILMLSLSAILILCKKIISL